MANHDQHFATTNKNNTRLTSNADLKSPLQLTHLDTPTFASSLTCSPADLTPPVSSFRSLRLDTLKSHTHTTATMAAIDSDTTLPLDEPSTIEGPPTYIHAKLRAPTPEYSRTTALSNFHGAFQSAKMLQQVLGLQTPEPFVRPPPVPPDLEQRFVAGLREYGVDLAMSDSSAVKMGEQAINVQDSGTTSVALGSKVLDDIKEEMESPVRATHSKVQSQLRPSSTVDSKSRDPEQEVGGASEQVSGDKAQVTGLHVEEHVDQNQQRAAVNDTQASIAQHSEAHSGAENDDEAFSDPHATFGSTTTLVDSELSRTSQARTIVADSISEPLPTDSKQKIISASTKLKAAIGEGHIPQPRYSSLANLAHQTGRQDAGEVVKGYINKYFRCRTLSDAKQRGSSAPPVLFPPQRVGKEQSWDVAQGQRATSAPDSFPSTNGIQSLEGAKGSTPSRETSFSRHGGPVPHSMTAIPSLPTSKKRPASSQGLPTAKVRLDESTTALPILDATQELLWKTKFPGNTYALLTIILTWTFTMQRLHKHIHDPYLFSINPAFPYAIAPPVHQKLVSIAFYDNSTLPHREIRFIGPSDVDEMSYNEVDIFSASEPSGNDEASKVCAMRRAMGLRSTSASAKENGTGRWCYIILKGRSSEPESMPAPHVMIAWPRSSVTSTSDCLHTVYPDTTLTVRPPLVKAPKRFSSLQNLAAAMRLDKNLRTASSGSLPGVVASECREGALMLKRRVVKMEKAGRVPLVEGYRVDVKRWEGWLEAVGRGRGKLIMWMERG